MAFRTWGEVKVILMREYTVEDALNIINEEFHIISVAYKTSHVEVLVEPKGNLEKSFEKVHVKLVEIGYNGLLTLEDGFLKIKLVKIGIAKGKKWKMIVLFIITFITVSFAGYLHISNFNSLLEEIAVKPPLNVYLGTLAYSSLFMLALFIHEMGHYIVSRIKGVDVSLPYFIPAPPPYGTLGALINMRTLPASIDTLAEIGIAGPLLGFLASLGVTCIGISLSVPVSESLLTKMAGEVTFLEYAPISYSLLYQLLVPKVEGVAILMHPIASAGLFLIFITFLNLLPAAQLDGGHVARGVLGEDLHRIVTWIVVIILLMTPYMIFGLIIMFLLFLGGGRHPGSMNRLSVGGKGKIIAGILYLILIILCIPAPVRSIEILALMWST